MIEFQAGSGVHKAACDSCGHHSEACSGGSVETALALLSDHGWWVTFDAYEKLVKHYCQTCAGKMRSGG